ncbi:site-specific integrase [Sporolactobacillus pectinivorans]|uniref:site-specific integrase n=1 Tax=Sporolactobacillus pectinivorans TaxID=1591408 RepID=UPI000C25F4CC|nr:site-specific integrase [Sporolactobacillus pectinivorans]
MRHFKHISSDISIQKAVEAFVHKASHSFYKFHLDDALQIVSLLPENINIDSVNWSFLQELFNKGTVIKKAEGVCKLINELIKHDCYSGNYSTIISTYKSTINLSNELPWLFKNHLQPFNLIVIKKNTGTKARVACFKNDSSNLFLSNLLKNFAEKNITGSRDRYPFYTCFQQSLGNTLIADVKSFSANTFKQQFYFFKKLDNSNYSHILLKKFYLWLLSLEDGKDILKWQDGIDRNMLKSPSFNINYDKGYLPIPLNPLDPIPIFDKWLIIPNGAEEISTKINSFSYKPIDFSIAADQKLKICLKNWFWNSTVSLSTRIDQANIGLKFINFIWNLRNKHNIKEVAFSQKDVDNLSVEEIFSYVQFIRSTRRNIIYIYFIRTFLTYISENNLHHVDPSVFKYLVASPNTANNMAKDIPDKELIQLEARIKANANGNYLNTIYYIIFHIALATEFRISQIINLKIDCLVNGVKNDYYLISNTKVSRGKKLKIPIIAYTRRYIELAIKFTQPVRDECTDRSVKQHIFIHNKNALNVRVAVVRSFSDYLKRTCHKLNIPEYSSQNLRDTYMTKSIEYAIKNKLSDLEVRVLTGHKQISTTTNHYVAEKIKDYLEATHMVVIGNPTINGKIQLNTHYQQKDLVNDQCGYCSHTSCIKKDGTLDCLMCSGFIATVDRIPFYQEKIDRINNEIKLTNLSAEKERLVTIKRLYLAYFEKLLELKEDCL